MMSASAMEKEEVLSLGSDAEDRFEEFDQRLVIETDLEFAILVADVE
jgi:hypothetical protein